MGEHEGYSAPFSFRADQYIKRGEINSLIVKVWSPWETKIDANALPLRTFRLIRNMVKGTYEHSDTFIPRDVNPVGIYGSVSVKFAAGATISARPNVEYTLDDVRTTANVSVSTPVTILEGDGYTVKVSVTNRHTGELSAEAESPVTASDTVQTALTVKQIKLWSTWDKGEPWLYDIRIQLLHDGHVLDSRSVPTGFRTICLERDARKTEFCLNGKRFYVRGTSYFPDCYISAMSRDRYMRDLLAIKSAGFNFIRVHVHVENEVFYDFCSEMGIGIMQDSEYNWMHPADDEFCAHFVKVYLENVEMLRNQPALLCWICLNEPSLRDPAGPNNCRAMTVNPGPALVAGLAEHDPSRPFIKGSYCSPDLLRRLAGIEDTIGDIQDYQYHLTKYFIEHYRMQKYAPNGGYIQFLFNDLCPQSFYGLYDWWGWPKKGL